MACRERLVRNALFYAHSHNAEAPSFSAAGATTHTAMTWFVHAMAAYPHIQKRAQAEVDAVVGRDRLPSFSDFEKMPYVRALVCVCLVIVQLRLANVGL
jgi:hypothetical protein